MAPQIPTIKLTDGTSIPALGFGTWKAKPGEVEKAVEVAIKAGYTYIDGAVNYKNQKEVGKGIQAGGKPREELYLLSKLWNTQHKQADVLPALEATLAELGTDYLDMWLIHWPVAFDAGSGNPHEDLMPSKDGKTADLDLETTLVDTWRGMIAARESGKTRAIGVSNFSPSMIEALYKETGVLPAVNQVEGHPLLQQPELHAWHEKNAVHIIHYSPLGSVYEEGEPLLENATIKKIAKKHSVDPAQVLVAWSLSKGVSTIPKSTTPDRIESNLHVLELKLDADDRKAIDALGQGDNYKRFNIPATYEPAWPLSVFGEPEEAGTKYNVNIGTQ